MVKKKASSADPLAGRIAALAELGMTVEPMKSRRGWWKIATTRATTPHPLARVQGYQTQADALRDAELITEKLRRYRRERDELDAEYAKVLSYTGVSAARLDALHREKMAAKEYERIEAARLGLIARA